MPGEATETVPVTEQEMQQPQVETGSYKLASHKCACGAASRRTGSWNSKNLRIVKETATKVLRLGKLPGFVS